MLQSEKLALIHLIKQSRVAHEQVASAINEITERAVHQGRISDDVFDRIFHMTDEVDEESRTVEQSYLNLMRSLELAMPLKSRGPEWSIGRSNSPGRRVSKVRRR